MIRPLRFVGSQGFFSFHSVNQDFYFAPYQGRSVYGVLIVQPHSLSPMEVECPFEIARRLSSPGARTRMTKEDSAPRPRSSEQYHGTSDVRLGVSPAQNMFLNPGSATMTNIILMDLMLCRNHNGKQPRDWRERQASNTPPGHVRGRCRGFQAYWTMWSFLAPMSCSHRR